MRLLLEHLFAVPVPMPITVWDGSTDVGDHVVRHRAGAPGGPGAAGTSSPTLHVRSRRAVRRMLWQPDELGIGRSWVAGELDVEGSLLEAVELLHEAGLRTRDAGSEPRRLEGAARTEALRQAVLIGAVGPAPRPPEEEIPADRSLPARLSQTRSARLQGPGAADLLVDVLGEGLADSLQVGRSALDHLVDRLSIPPRGRLLDLSPSSGALALHAAGAGIAVVALAASSGQAELIRERAALAGLAERVEVSLQPWRELDAGSFDAVARASLLTPFPANEVLQLADVVRRQLRPRGRLVLQALVTRPEAPRPARTFVDAYVVPGLAPVHLGPLVADLVEGGLDVTSVQERSGQLAATLRSWSRRLEEGAARSDTLEGPDPRRAWRLAAAGSVAAAEGGRLAAYEVVATRPVARGR